MKLVGWGQVNLQMQMEEYENTLMRMGKRGTND